MRRDETNRLVRARGQPLEINALSLQRPQKVGQSARAGGRWGTLPTSPTEARSGAYSSAYVQNFPHRLGIAINGALDYRDRGAETLDVAENRASANQIADWFVAFCHEHGNPITNLHLQKYLYYAQGWYLAFFEAPLFGDRLEAWIHGPVQPEVYRRFKHNTWNPIADDVALPLVGDEIHDHLVEVISAYGRFSAWDLERMTHRESPWREARNGLPDDEPSHAVISTESMRRYFVERLEREKASPE